MKLKGMTILENMIAFMLIVTALVIAGTGFYTAGSFITRGKMYQSAADEAQCIMESGILESVAEAMKKNRLSGCNSFDSEAVQNCMKSFSPGYKLSADKSYYYSETNWVVIKPCSYADGDLTRAPDDPVCIAASQSVNSEALKKIPGIYLYVCVPVDGGRVQELKNQGMDVLEAIGTAEYIPLIYYIGEWEY